MEYPKIHLGRKKMLSIALMAVVIGSVFGGALWNLGVYYATKPSLRKFSSYQELVAFLKREPQVPQSLFQGVLSMFQIYQPRGGLVFESALKGSALTLAYEGVEASGYSTTNIQVEGVDEADVVKTDGDYLYLTSGEVVYILRAFPLEVLSKLDLNTTVLGLFVNDEKLVILQEEYPPYGPEVIYRSYIPYFKAVNTSILVYDISDRSSPVLERNVTVDGYYLSSRMIGDYVYTVLVQPAYFINDSVVYLPKIRSGNYTVEIEPSSIHHTDLPDYYYSFTNIVSINVQDAEQEPKVETFLIGATSCIYVSIENIYLTTLSYQNSETNIHKIRIREGKITRVADGSVPGYVLNQFSMDEYRGYFRIATTKGQVSRSQIGTLPQNHVYVLNSNLNIVGRLENIAPGERIYSARFIGDRCYLVTFRKIDPLFVIDLEDPETPRVLGKLKIPGYSDYLHSYDETHIIGIGKETVPAEEGDFSWYQGVKIALFDVSNVSKPMEIDKFIIGDRGTDSPVLRDHKAFLFSWSKNLLVLPILLAEIDEANYPGGVPPNAHGDYVWQGAYVFHISIEGGFILKGRITHIEDNADLIKSGFYFYSTYAVKRALYIDQVLYTISDKKVKMNSLEDLVEIGVLELP